MLRSIAPFLAQQMEQEDELSNINSQEITQILAEALR